MLYIYKWKNNCKRLQLFNRICKVLHRFKMNSCLTEIIYTHRDGREEIRYRRPKDSPEALELINGILDLQRQHGKACPYSFRH